MTSAECSLRMITVVVETVMDLRRRKIGVKELFYKHRKMRLFQKTKAVNCVVLVILTLQALIIFHVYHTATSWSPCICNANRDDVTVLNSNGISKPHLVMGILTSEGKKELRDTQRETWILQAMHTDIPFRLTYKFLLDEPTKATEAENKINNDILYLNVSARGRANKFGKKLYKWFKYIHEQYPDALLGARVDDDTYMCVPEMFERLAELQSHRLYYGWGHVPEKGENVRRIDEMFVVLGDEVMERIAKRKYCETKKECDSKTDLVELDWGGLSIYHWLNIYTDLDNYADNKNIVNFGRGQPNRDELVNKNFCDKYLLYHKSSIKASRLLHSYQIERTSGISIDNKFIGTITGTLFSGSIVRDLPLNMNTMDMVNVEKVDVVSCDKWAVVTTIFDPSKAVIRIASSPEWCLVIVGDMRTPEKGTYMASLSGNRVQFLSVQDQSLQYPELSKSIPLNNLGRKNIGYIYAIHHGAKYIWDFDDDNIGVVNVNDFVDSTGYVTACNEFTETKLNPYPYFGVKDVYTWPRGFPLQHIKNNKTLPSICKLDKRIKTGVIQSLANFQPDVDAIYRLTRNIPFNFTATKDTAPFVVPNGVYSPFNAQATVWCQSAFTFLPLPLSVNPRVSDIWRSYIAQFFMHKNDISLVFSMPYIDQIRNEHMDIKDFNAENDLYEKSDQMIEFLSSKEASALNTLTGLYEQLYRRKYIEIDDLKFINAWTRTYEAITKK